MADLDDDAVIVTLPADGDGTTITKVVEEGKKVDDPIDDLKSQFDILKNQNQTLNQRATAAETAHQQTARQLEDAHRELQTTKESVTSSQLDTVLSGIQAAEAEATAAEREYVAAAESGDFAAQARAQRKMSGAEARIQRLQEAKGDLEDMKTTKVQPRQETRPQSRQATQDPVEAVIQNGNVPAKSAQWLRNHPDCITDPKKNARMLAAHNLAVADDVPIESDEYFRRIEEGVAEKSPITRKEEPTVKVETTGKRPMSAAGPSNSGGGMNGGGEKVALTAREKLASEDGTLVWNYDSPTGKFKKGDPIGNTEMARRKSQMQKDGLYDKTLTS